MHWSEGILQRGDVKAFRRDGFYHLSLQKPYQTQGFHYRYIPEPVQDGRITVEAWAFARVCRAIRRFWVAGDFYYLFAVSRRGKYWLYRRTEGKSETLVNWVPCEHIHKEAALNTLQVQIVGGVVSRTITAEINGHAVVTLGDWTPGQVSGDVGVCVGALAASGQPEARFRNFLVFETE